MHPIMGIHPPITRQISRPFGTLFAPMVTGLAPTITAIATFQSKTIMDIRTVSPSSPSSSAGPLRRAAATAQRDNVEDEGFYTAFKNALQSVSSAQNHSTNLQREVQLENPNVSLEETMVAMQKAQIAFQASLHVRNRMVQAYTDIMNMQV